jgi:hypothetical protein
MNGIAEKIPSIKEKLEFQKENKKKNNLQFALGMILSNILVFLLCSHQDKIQPALAPNEYSPHPHYKIITITANSLLGVVKTSTNEALKISILNEENQKIITSGFLLEAFKNPNTDSSQFKIEIPDGDVIELASHEKNKLIITPYIEATKTITKKRNNGANNYEYDL